MKKIKIDKKKLKANLKNVSAKTKEGFKKFRKFAAEYTEGQKGLWGDIGNFSGMGSDFYDGI